MYIENKERENTSNSRYIYNLLQTLHGHIVNNSANTSWLGEREKMANCSMNVKGHVS